MSGRRCAGDILSSSESQQELTVIRKMKQLALSIGLAWSSEAFPLECAWFNTPPAVAVK
jgi:hypothetical protein